MHLHVLIALALVFLSQVTYTVVQRGPAPPTARKIVEFEFEPRDSREPEDEPRDSREPEEYGNVGFDGDDGYDGDYSDDYAGFFLTSNQIKKLYNLPEEVTIDCDTEDVHSISRSPGDADKRTTSCRFAGGRFARSDSSRNPCEYRDGSTCCETILRPVVPVIVRTSGKRWEFVAHESRTGRYQSWWEAECGACGNCNCDYCKLIYTPQTVLISDLDFTMLNPRWRWFYRPTYCRCRDYS